VVLQWLVDMEFVLTIQLRLKAGDAFLCTQRLAYLWATNTAAMPCSIVFFRVSHVDHEVLKDPALSSLWLEYKYASHYMDSALEARSVFSPAELKPSPVAAHYAIHAPPTSYSSSIVPAVPTQTESNFLNDTSSPTPSAAPGSDSLSSNPYYERYDAGTEEGIGLLDLTDRNR
jgi:hypothetical protein